MLALVCREVWSASKGQVSSLTGGRPHGCCVFLYGRGMRTARIVSFRLRVKTSAWPTTCASFLFPQQSPASYPAAWRMWRCCDVTGLHREDLGQSAVRSAFLTSITAQDRM